MASNAFSSLSELRETSELDQPSRPQNNAASPIQRPSSPRNIIGALVQPLSRLPRVQGGPHANSIAGLDEKASTTTISPPKPSKLINPQLPQAPKRPRVESLHQPKIRSKLRNVISVDDFDDGGNRMAKNPHLAKYRAMKAAGARRPIAIKVKMPPAPPNPSRVQRKEAEGGTGSALIPNSAPALL